MSRENDQIGRNNETVTFLCVCVLSDGNEMFAVKKQDRCFSGVRSDIDD